MTFRRNEFSGKTKRKAYLRSGGICECHLIPHVFERACGLPLGDANTFYEHIDPDRISSRNDVDNCAALTKTCWSYKTARYDLPTIAKSNRVSDLARGIKRGWYRPMAGSRRSNIKLPFRGPPIDRTTGRPWRSRP